MEWRCDVLVLVYVDVVVDVVDGAYICACVVFVVVIPCDIFGSMSTAPAGSCNECRD